MKKVAKSAGVLALALILGACSAKRGNENNDTTAAVVGTEGTTAAEETTAEGSITADPDGTTAEALPTTIADATGEGTEAVTDTNADPGETEPETTEPVTVDRSEFIVKLSSINVSDYIDLSKVQDIQIKNSDLAVDEGSLKYEIVSAMVDDFGFALEEKDRAVEFGDTVTIDYEGYVDDVKFDGGTAQDFDLGIGSGQFIPGFEEGIVGKKAGDSFDLPVTFPEDYHSAALAGKKAVFKINLKKVSGLPEITDEMIQEKSQGYYESYQKYYDEVAEEYKVSVRNNVIFNNIMDAVEEKKEHEGLINEYVQSQLTRLDQMCAAYGIDRETYIGLMGYTQEAFEADLQNYGKNYAKQKLAIIGICREGGTTVDEEELNAYIKKLVADYNLESEESLLSVMTKDEIEFEILYNKFMTYIQEFKTVD